jgi:hypothetical protein
LTPSEKNKRKFSPTCSTYFEASGTRVARWFVFKPKIQIWVNYGAPWNEKKLVYYMALWNIFLPFGIFYGNLVI